jgi:hypothetical protein
MNPRAGSFRLLADLLTVSRVLLAFLLAVIGWARGAEGLPLAVAVLLISWFTDLIDGPLARCVPVTPPSWIGRHDAEADLATSLGVAAYLSFSGYLPFWLAVALVVLILGVWFLHSHQLAWPLYAVPYAILAVVAFGAAPVWGRIMVGYLFGTLVLRYRRLATGFLPEFFHAVATLRGKRPPRS